MMERRVYTWSEGFKGALEGRNGEITYCYTEEQGMKW